MACPLRLSTLKLLVLAGNMRKAITVTSLSAACGRDKGAGATVAKRSRSCDLLVYLEEVVKSSQCFNEEICSLVGELIPTGNEEVKGLVQVKIIVATGEWTDGRVRGRMGG